MISMMNADRPSHPLSPYAGTIVQTLTNPDGTVSLIQIDPSDSPNIPTEEIVTDAGPQQILNVSSIHQVRVIVAQGMFM